MRTLLVVDDSRLARMMVAKVLAVARPLWRIVEAESAAAAIETASAQRFDGAVLDFNMPGLDGVSLAAHLREEIPTLPLAILSANYQREVVGRAEHLGALFLSKPLRPTEFEAFLSLVDGAR